jgi:hypothetical protein
MVKLISLLDSAAPFVQALDCLLMLVCGVYCLRSTRRRWNIGLAILTVSCFVSAVILLGFFLSAAPNDRPVVPLPAQARSVAYLAARLLAPLELLLFVIGIVIVARRNLARSSE